MMDRITGRAPPSPDPRPDCKLGKSTFTYRGVNFIGSGEQNGQE